MNLLSLISRLHLVSHYVFRVMIAVVILVDQSVSWCSVRAQNLGQTSINTNPATEIAWMDYNAGRWLAESRLEWRPAQIRKYQSSSRNVRGRRGFILSFNNTASSDTLGTSYQPAGLRLQRSAVHLPDRIGKRFSRRWVEDPARGKLDVSRSRGCIGIPPAVLVLCMPLQCIKVKLQSTFSCTYSYNSRSYGR